jgi:hypothetical protein
MAGNESEKPLFFALSFFQFLMNGFNADAPSDGFRKVRVHLAHIHDGRR